MSYRMTEGPVTGGGRSVRLAGARQRAIDVQPPLLCERLVMSFDELDNESPCLARELRSTVAPPIKSRQQAEITLSVKRSEEHTSELQSLTNLVCRLLLEKKKKKKEKDIKKYDTIELIIND